MIFSDDIFSDDLLWWSTLIIFSDDGFYKILQIAEGVSEWQSCLNARDATASKNQKSVFLPKYWKFVIEGNYSFDKVVIVDTADKVGQEVSPNFWINAGKKKL